MNPECYKDGKPIGFEEFLNLGTGAPEPWRRGYARIALRVVYGIWWILAEMIRRRFVRDCHRLIDDLERKCGGPYTR